MRPVVLLVLALTWIPASARSQDSTSPDRAVSVAEVDQILRLGVELEQQRRWGEALTHYEDALRRYPGQRLLSERLLLARLHYEVARRYADASYLESLQELTPYQAGDMYNEVLLKIHAHHVDSPVWSRLFDQGTTAVTIAFKEPTFQQRHGLRLDEATLDQQLAEIRQTVGRQGLKSRQDLRVAAASVAQQIHGKLGVAQQAVILEYACAAVASLDDYSAFLTGSQLDEIMSQIEGSFVGLGVELKAEVESLLIVNVIPSGPADRAGLKPGDRIIQVAGRSTADVPPDSLADLLKGPEGTVVDVVVLGSQGTAQSLRLRRETVEVPSVERAEIIDGEYGVGYLKLSSFQKNTSRDVEAALWRLHREGMRSLIVDVCGNPGGLLTSAVEVADKFISEGTIVATRGRGTGEDFDYKAHMYGTWRVPLVVLMDANSASASEIFAAAIRDAQRGTIVGERSFGKGTVQGIFPLTIGKAGLRITTAKFYSPTYRPISGVGVQPHVLVQTVARPNEDGTSGVAGHDAFVNTALQIARRQLAQR